MQTTGFWFLLATLLAGAPALQAGSPGPVAPSSSPLPVGAFPAGFLWGTATSAHQVEGGNVHNQWWEFEQVPGNIHHGDRSGAAADHWNRYEQDLDLARELGTNSYRFSVEWSRIEPEEGVIDEAALQHYSDVVDACLARGITPMVTLFHFSLPTWLTHEGGFTWKKAPARFERFARLVAARLGDRVDLWCTINEPMVYVAGGYLAGVFPPGREGDMKDTLGVVVGMVRAHMRAYKAVHDADRVDADGDGKAAMVGIAKHQRVLEPHDRGDLRDHLMTNVARTFFNDLFLLAVTKGRVVIRLPGGHRFGFRIPFMKPALDYFGLNYYSRDIVEYDPSQPGGFGRRVKEGAPVTELGWEIYPEGLHTVIMEAATYGLPIYITENGLADADDDQRPAFVRDHLAQVARAIGDGADVRGYFHWSLMDNFEWHEGFEPRFGLFEVDYATQTRTLREGGRVYGEIARRNALPPPPQ